MFYNQDKSKLVALAGMGRTCTDTNWRTCGRPVRFGWGLFERFDVLKRLVIAEMN
jgi:hypothetical protein